ncbi:MAG TPA: amidase [Ruminococcus sp.]|nr:amidase [Ruminococcus sp.]
MKVLVVIDMQKDFTTGALGNPQTAAVTDAVVNQIRAFRAAEPDGLVIATMDTHTPDYLNTQEGKNLPVPHCIRGTDGWKLEDAVADALPDDAVIVEKGTFGAIRMPEIIGTGRKIDEIQLIGVCTDICVISNAMILKAAFPEVPVRVIPDCCAGVTPESHENALAAMRACQIITAE